MTIRIASALALGLAAAPAQAATNRPAAEAKIDWSALARQDVLAAYDIFAANHPGMHDPANPGFADQLAEARDHALAYAAKAGDRAGYGQALGAFTTKLADGHAKVVLNSDQAPGVQWPGFVAAWRGDTMKIHRSIEKDIPRGAEIVACDGLGMRALVERRLETVSFRPAEPGQWWRLGPVAFTHSAVMPDNRPSRCTLRAPSGDEWQVALSWRAATEELATWIGAASDGERTPIGLTEPRPGLFLIGMPTFSPDAAGVKAYRALFDDMRARKAELDSAQAIVIDLRHNNGGSSRWSRDAARILWGADAVDARIADYFEEVRIWWRASPGNIAYLRELAAEVRANGNGDTAVQVLDLRTAMKAALDRGEPFYVDDGEDPAAQGDPATSFATPVYVITPGRCASACLDALDAFTRFDNVRLIGAPTSGDTTYMEVRTEALPSGKGRVVIPIKIWAARPRGSGETYAPDIPVDDLDWSTETFLDRVERQVARHAAR